MRCAAPEKPNALMTELDQVLGDFVGGIAVVDVDARVTVPWIFRRRNDAHEFDLVCRQEFDQLLALRHRRRQH